MSVPPRCRERQLINTAASARGRWLRLCPTSRVALPPLWEEGARELGASVSPAAPSPRHRGRSLRLEERLAQPPRRSRWGSPTGLRGVLHGRSAGALRSEEGITSPSGSQRTARGLGVGREKKTLLDTPKRSFFIYS